MEKLSYEHGTYRTGPVRITFMARTLTSLLFYSRLFSIVVRGSAQAKRGLYGTPEWCEGSLATLRALEAAGVKFEITGIDAFTAVEGPCVFIANHMSTLETFILPTIIASFKDATFVVKQSLVDYPHLQAHHAREGPHHRRPHEPPGRSEGSARGRDRAAEGRKVHRNFPQTTRTPVFDPAQFNTIGIKLAKKAGVPVVPVALTTSAWGNGTFLKDYGKIDPSKKVRFAFGKPLWIKERGTEEHEGIIEFITGKLKEWEAEDQAGKA